VIDGIERQVIRERGATFAAPCAVILAVQAASKREHSQHGLLLPDEWLGQVSRERSVSVRLEACLVRNQLEPRGTDRLEERRRD
jgi:hypothetical protein